MEDRLGAAIEAVRPFIDDEKRGHWLDVVEMLVGDRLETAQRYRVYDAYWPLKKVSENG